MSCCSWSERFFLAFGLFLIVMGVMVIYYLVKDIYKMRSDILKSRIEDMRLIKNCLIRKFGPDCELHCMQLMPYFYSEHEIDAAKVEIGNFIRWKNSYEKKF